MVEVILHDCFEAGSRHQQLCVRRERPWPRPLIVVVYLASDVAGRPGHLFVDGASQSQGSFEMAWLVVNRHVGESRQCLAKRSRPPHSGR